MNTQIVSSTVPLENSRAGLSRCDAKKQAFVFGLEKGLDLTALTRPRLRKLDSHPLGGGFLLFCLTRNHPRINFQ